ncbi:hypothetical protein CSPX01_12722 [Colletotrichum filicis]|nr:hypothetical protein CSPX01_12722 [Colletotrichum filicis]
MCLRRVFVPFRYCTRRVSGSQPTSPEALVWFSLLPIHSFSEVVVGGALWLQGGHTSTFGGVAICPAKSLPMQCTRMERIQRHHPRKGGRPQYDVRHGLAAGHHASFLAG